MTQIERCTVAVVVIAAVANVVVIYLTLIRP